MIRYDQNGWLFPMPQNEVREFSESDLRVLLLLAEEDDLWADCVHQEVIRRDQEFGKRKETRTD